MYSSPPELPHSIDEFTAFFAQRRDNLIARIKDGLKTQAPEPASLSAGPPGADLDEELAEGDDED